MQVTFLHLYTCIAVLEFQETAFCWQQTNIFIFWQSDSRCKTSFMNQPNTIFSMLFTLLDRNTSHSNLCATHQTSLVDVVLLKDLSSRPSLSLRTRPRSWHRFLTSRPQQCIQVCELTSKVYTKPVQEKHQLPRSYRDTSVPCLVIKPFLWLARQLETHYQTTYEIHHVPLTVYC